ncbi:uracil-DNA glycosylase [Acetobacter garciniae]|nr:uracil-DNA glycosylase family protein [Acetobacter garciniae]
MEAELSLLRLYTEWGVDTAVADTSADHRRAVSHPLPPVGGRATSAPPGERARLADGAAAYAPDSADHAPRPAGMPHGLPLGMPTALRGENAPSATPQAGASVADAITLARQVAARADSPQALATAMDRFETCPLRATAMHTLIPQGPMQAPLMLIGEAPDADEDRSGQVFAGLCGTLLDEMLAPLPLARADLLLATALPWRPPGGRPPSDLEQRVCLPFLERAITLFAPQRLVLCGRMPATMLLDRDTPARRQWQALDLPGLPPLPVLCMRHPLQLRASSTARREIWQSLLIIMQSLRQGG